MSRILNNKIIATRCLCTGRLMWSAMLMKPRLEKLIFLAHGTHNACSSLSLRTTSPTLLSHTTSSSHLSFQRFGYFFFFFTRFASAMISLPRRVTNSAVLVSRIQTIPFENKLPSGQTSTLENCSLRLKWRTRFTAKIFFLSASGCSMHKRVKH